jgi:hypothetical protein
VHKMSFSNQRNLKKNEHKRFKRRIQGIMKKANDLTSLFDAEVALFVLKNDRYYTFRSIDALSWAPSMEQIVSYLRDLRSRCLPVLQAKSYPTPVNKSPSHFTNSNSVVSLLLDQPITQKTVLMGRFLLPPPPKFRH